MRCDSGVWRSLRQARLFLLSCVLLGLWMTGCSSTTPGVRPSSSAEETTEVTDIREDGKFVILTTFTVLADMTRNVAGDKAIVESLTKPGTEIHGYEPTPSDLVRAQEADLIFDNGLNLERWAEKLFNSVPDAPHITLSDGIQPVAIAEDAYQGKPNPHAWMSPANALIYVENIRKALVEADPANAETYNANAAAYSQQIRDLDQKLKESVSNLPDNQRYMVTCEGAFSYLTRDYGLQEAYIWAVNSEQQATPRQIERAIATVKTNQIPVVFCESTVSDEAQRQIARESGAKFGGVFYVDSLSPTDGPAPTYLKLLEHNISTLITGLTDE